MTKAPWITIGHGGGCRRPDPARYIHRYDMHVTVNGHPVNVDMCPGCDQYVVCQQKCWDERKMGALADQAARRDEARRQARMARQRRNDRRALALFCAFLLAMALLYLGLR